MRGIMPGQAIKAVSAMAGKFRGGRNDDLFRHVGGKFRGGRNDDRKNQCKVFGVSVASM